MPDVAALDGEPDPVRAAPVLDVERAVCGGHSEPVIAVRLTQQRYADALGRFAVGPEDGAPDARPPHVRRGRREPDLDPADIGAADLDRGGLRLLGREAALASVPADPAPGVLALPGGDLQGERTVARQHVERAVRGNPDEPGLPRRRVPYPEEDSLDRFTVGAEHRAPDPGRQPDLDACHVGSGDLDRGGLLLVRREAALAVVAAKVPGPVLPRVDPELERTVLVGDVERTVSGGHSELAVGG